MSTLRLPLVTALGAALLAPAPTPHLSVDVMPISGSAAVGASQVTGGCAAPSSRTELRFGMIADDTEPMSPPARHAAVCLAVYRLAD